MTATITVTINGAAVPVVLDDDAIAAIAAALPTREQPTQSEFVSVPEAAEILRCRRSRIDDLLSRSSLPRVKEGARTLIRRADIDAYLQNGGKPMR